LTLFLNGLLRKDLGRFSARAPPFQQTEASRTIKFMAALSAAPQK
jgi:hypothetical protein